MYTEEYVSTKAILLANLCAFCARFQDILDKRQKKFMDPELKTFHENRHHTSL